MDHAQKRGLEDTMDSQLVPVTKKARNDEVVAFAGETLRDRQLMAAVGWFICVVTLATTVRFYVSPTWHLAVH